MSFNQVKTSLPDQEQLRSHIQAADLPTLMMTTAHLSGDYSLLKPEWKPYLDYGVPKSSQSTQEQAEIRQLCLDRLLRLQSNNASLPSKPTFDELRVIAHWLVGAGIDPYLPLLEEELSCAEDDMRRPSWSKTHVAPERDFSVAIIGAGESGLITALRLSQAKVPFVVYEKSDEVGGTWRENTYPGCRVDINSFLYSFSFARHLWTDYFAKSGDVLAYMKQVAEHFELYKHIRFNQQVNEARWDEAQQQWVLTLNGQQQVRHNLVVFAVGQLNRPMIPEITGREAFKGPNFHSANWDHSIDWKNKRVAVIGTGASAVQFIQQLANVAEHVGIFARTPNWLLPSPDLHDTVSADKLWLLDNLPTYDLWYRASLAIPQSVGLFDEIKLDPAYPPTEHSVSALNGQLRAAIEEWIRPQIAQRPDLESFVIPNAPVGGKRIIRDNGKWLATLQRDNVSVIQDSIEAINETGILTVEGGQHDYDVIVYGTGFHASKFLSPVKIIGRDNKNLHDWWQDDARAYIGTSMPGFPNLFCMYGPNTNLVVNASIIMFSELTSKYIVDAVRQLLASGAHSMEVRQPVFDAYVQHVDDANKERAWGFSKVNSWYKNSKGRVTQNYPDSAADFWWRTHQIRPSDYSFS